MLSFSKDKSKGGEQQKGENESDAIENDKELLALEDKTIEDELDKENETHALNKISKKASQQKADKSEGSKPALREHLREKLRDNDEDILDSNSRSVQSWSNVPRFHMDSIMQKSLKQKKNERL